MEQVLKTVVLKISATESVNEALTIGAEPSVTRSGTGAGPAVSLTTLDTVEGERAEIETEADTVAVSVSMPFSLIAPKVATAADAGGDNWGIEACGATGAGLDAGAGVKVAVLDTGIAPDHPAFADVNPIQKNFTDEADADQNGHGTHCAGTIFGQDVDGRRIGVARGVRDPLIGKVLGAGGGDTESIFSGILWAREMGADIVSMSLGMDFPGFQKRLVQSGRHQEEATSIALQGYRDNLRLFDQIAELFRANTIVKTPLLIAAAGNESERPSYTIATAPPAAADDILSVGALDKAGKIAPFSNTRPDCAGPGVDILSASHTGGLVSLSGTSMATPHVAGIAAIAAQGLASAGRFTPQELRTDVLARAKPVPGLGKVEVGRGQIVL